MAKKLRTEHSGAKNRGGHWGKRAEAKTLSKKVRRIDSKKEVTDQLKNTVDWNEGLAKDLNDLIFNGLHNF